MKNKVNAYSQVIFDDWCKNHNLDDSNVEQMTDCAFISIIGTKDVIKNYLNEEGTEHWFKKNHDNVLNLEFDDVEKDTEFNGYHAYAMTEDQAKLVVEFIEHNIGKNIYVHCRAGQSRSVGVVCYVLRAYPHLYESDVDREYMKPNIDVLAKLSKHLWE